jgi:hypothetical protein
LVGTNVAPVQPEFQRSKSDSRRKRGMKIGANTMIWAGDFTQEHLPLIDKVAALGFDVIEIRQLCT